MSKSKKRILHGNSKSSLLNCSREDAVRHVTNSVKLKKFDKDAKNMLTLFGISGEELAEAGLTWEELKVVSPYL